MADKITPILHRDLSERAGTAIEVAAAGEEVRIRYPKAFSLQTILPQIRLEIGPLAAWVPNEEKEIRPYAAEQVPAPFSRQSTKVRTILAERTFWEKATILHQEAHRGPDKKLLPRFSRHYYDLYRLSQLQIRDKALSQLRLLHDVVQFKMQFYRCPWAKYEEAKSGSLRLLPPAHNEAKLRKDYQDMQGMLFGAIPGFEEIITGLGELEKAINKL